MDLKILLKTVAVAKEIGIGREKAERIAKNIPECVHERLREYLK